MPPTGLPSGEETIALDDELWEELVELTGGAANLCFQCGVCTAACPWGLVRQGALSVRTLIRQAQLGLRDGNRSLWLCTACAQCEADCPRGVKISQVMRGLRSLAWEQRKVEKGLPSLLWSEYWNQNPWSQPPSQRSRWADKLDIPAFDPRQHELLLYVGCTSSYDRRAQKIARSLVRLLRSAGVAFGFLGDDEPCCGEAVLSVGHAAYFEEIAAQTSRLLQEKGVSQLVAISPHCYDVFKNHYPPSAAFEAVHYTQYLARLVDEGRLVFNRPLERRVAFQDPCFLGRHNSEYEAPRRVLGAIPGLELVEMQDRKEDSLCCGGGGGRMWLETAAGERFADLRVRQAVDCEAGILATACPFCAVCLGDSAKMLKTKELEVQDVAEIAELALSG